MFDSEAHTQGTGKPEALKPALATNAHCPEKALLSSLTLRISETRAGTNVTLDGARREATIAADRCVVTRRIARIS